jgi:RNA polymerase sigma factor (sigma-70 family)
MTSNPAEVDQASAARQRVEMIRSAIEGEFQDLYRAVAAEVRSTARGRCGGDRAEWVDEVLGEAVCRALTHPGSYDPGRPVVPWVVGIARNLLRGEARDAATRPRRADIEDAMWERLLGVVGTPDGAASARMDAELMLRRITPPAREAIVARFLKGLDGQDLARAIGAPSVGAARVRVARALKALRDQFGTSGPEVTP